MAGRTGVVGAVIMWSNLRTFMHGLPALHGGQVLGSLLCTGHLRDMISLQACHPDVYEEFMKSKFTCSEETKHAFSILTQAQEQDNASVKGDGGTVGFN